MGPAAIESVVDEHRFFLHRKGFGQFHRDTGVLSEQLGDQGEIGLSQGLPRVIRSRSGFAMAGRADLGTSLARQEAILLREPAMA